jgi:hypothetical protein
MAELSHSPDRQRAPPRAVLLVRCARRLARAPHYGHGTDNPHDDAAAIARHVLLCRPARAACAASARRRLSRRTLIRRIEERSRPSISPGNAGSPASGSTSIRA